MPTVLITTPRISDSATILQTRLREELPSRVRRRRNNSPAEYSSLHTDFLINWGSSTLSRCNITQAGRTLNPPSAVVIASNKLRSFDRWAENIEVRLPSYTRDRTVASLWFFENPEAKVYCRQTLTGHSGAGIVVANNVDELVEAPLYTLGIEIHHEYRLHVMGGVVIDGVRKAFDPEVPEEDRNYDVRNHSEGTIFVRTGRGLEAVANNTAVKEMAIEAVRSLGLDFGAVDIIKDREDNYFVIEVNTACGLTGTTTDRYVRSFVSLINGTPIQEWSMEEFQQTEEPQDTVTTLTQQTETYMNISECTAGQRVLFNPSTRGNIRSLTVGTTYVIERVSLTTIFVRNDGGIIRAYQVGSFQSVDTQRTEGPSDGSVDNSHPTDSPSRIVRLADGSSVNVSGTASFIGESTWFSNETYEVFDMRIGEVSRDVFIGIKLEGDDRIYRFKAENFNEGVVSGSPVSSSSPPLLDLNQRNVREGDHVQVRVSAGGHQLPVDTVAHVLSVNQEDRVLVVSVEGITGTTRIHPQRVIKLNPRDLARILREQTQLSAQQTTSFTLGNYSYRVPSGDLEVIRELLLRFTV